VIAAPIYAFHAWVIRDLYHWFAVPLGAPPVGYVSVLGICLLLSALRMKTAEKDRPPHDLLAFVTASAALWLMGFAVSWWAA
jgi:hypothetical protein